jgi:RAT1-interacting protein
MVKDGYEDIVNIDISSVVIEQMSEKHMDIPQLTCTVLLITPFSYLMSYGLCVQSIYLSVLYA